MGSVSFTREKQHYNPKRGLQELIQEELSGNPDFISTYSQRNNSDELQLGKLVKQIEGKAKEDDNKKIEELYDSMCPETGFVDYCILGTKGYYVLATDIVSNKKRGTSYQYAYLDNRYIGTKFRTVSSSYSDRKEVEKSAESYALRNLDKTIVIVNQKDEIVAKVLIKEKYYDKKPTIKETPTKKLVNGYYYLFRGKHYVG